MSVLVKTIENRSNLIVLGIECINGPIEVGMSAGFDEENNNIGIITNIQVNASYVNIINSGDKAVIKIDSNYELKKNNKYDIILCT